MRLFALLMIPGVFIVHAATFEVAAIRHAAPGSEGSDVDIDHGLLRMRNVTLKRCIVKAYGIPEAQITGGPRWVGGLRFDIDAKAEGDVSGREVAAMLQELLSERFGLTLHHETRVLAGYALMVGKSGMKAQRSAAGTESDTHGSRGRIDAKATSMAKLAMRLASVLGAPVVDMTELAGNFDFTLQWTPEDMHAAPAGAGPAEGPSLFTALEEQLGLRLQARKTPADMLVIDGAREPSGN